MTRFSKPTKKSTETVNYEGETAYKLFPELELYSAVCTASLQPKFYEGTQDFLLRIRQLINAVNPEFAEKLAIYAREQMYLRSIPLVLMVELARIGRAKARSVERVIQRADELYEILGYYQQANRREGTKVLNKLSKQLQKGIANAFKKFDEYQFGKYNRKTVPSLRDAMFLTHPHPKSDEQALLFSRIAQQELLIPYTWETELSERGNTKEVWEELIDSKKVGYMATLRNLRNILNAGVSEEHTKKVMDYISNGEAVVKSKQLPFRFLSAYRELKKIADFQTPYVLNSLEIAIQVSSLNIPIDDSNILIACDVSRSMQTTISPRSKVQYFDIGLMLGMMLNLRLPNTIVGMFGDDWKTIGVPKNDVLRNADEFHQREGEVGYATNGWKVIDWLIQTGTKADKVMMFTDCQMWDSEKRDEDGFKILPSPYFSLFERETAPHQHISKLWAQYKQIVPHAKLYLFDLAGYGNTPLSTNQQDVFFIAGWSDKIFNVLKALDEGSNAVKEIERIEL